MTRPIYVFCHGLSGYGEYDEQYAANPYWGGASGDVISEWRSRGLEAFGASVSPHGSAWDRACELYAQIAGVRTDYGENHSRQYRHDRYGRDFADQPLIPAWDDDTRLYLIGHSFGGATIRLMCELLANGSVEEREATPADDLSPLFAGGMADRIAAIVTLAAPSNGTVAYDMVFDPQFDTSRVRIPLQYRLLDRLLKRYTKISMDGRDQRDWASYDMMVDNAQALNERITMLTHVYYLSVACDVTKPGEDGARVPDLALIDPLFVKTSMLMGCYSGTTAAGCVIDESWHANDGLVNTISARAPFGAPQKPLDRQHVEKGVWNVMPDLHVDHAFFSGDYLAKNDPHLFFLDLLGLLQSLE